MERGKFLKPGLEKTGALPGCQRIRSPRVRNGMQPLNTLFRLVRDFQAALDTFDTIGEPVIPRVNRRIGAGKVA